MLFRILNFHALHVIKYTDYGMMGYLTIFVLQFKTYIKINIWR